MEGLSEAKVLVQWFCPGNSLVHRDCLSRKQPSQVIETERPDLYGPNVQENGTAHRSRKLVWMGKETLWDLQSLCWPIVCIVISKHPKGFGVKAPVIKPRFSFFHLQILSGKYYLVQFLSCAINPIPVIDFYSAEPFITQNKSYLSCHLELLWRAQCIGSKGPLFTPLSLVAIGKLHGLWLTNICSGTI